jgi:hypothetical protein
MEGHGLDRPGSARVQGTPSESAQGGASGVTPWSRPKREVEGSRRRAWGAPVSALERSRALPYPSLGASRSGARRPNAPRAPLN